MATNQILLSEHFRPQTLDELNLSANDIASLKSMASDKGSIGNLLFHGVSGIGKSDAAQILIKEMQLSAKIFPNQKLGKLNALKGFMEGYFSPISSPEELKVLIINDVDQWGKEKQTYLAEALDEYQGVGRFIMTAKKLDGVRDNLLTKLSVFEFFIPEREKTSLIQNMITRCESDLQGASKAIPTEVISKIVHLYFPDQRKIAEHLDKEALALAS